MYSQRLQKNHKSNVLTAALNIILLCRSGIFIGNFEHSQCINVFISSFNPTDKYLFKAEATKEINELNLIKVSKKDKRTASF